jgi:hypothetical protein
VLRSSSAGVGTDRLVKLNAIDLTRPTTWKL